MKKKTRIEKTLNESENLTNFVKKKQTNKNTDSF